MSASTFTFSAALVGGARVQSKVEKRTITGARAARGEQSCDSIHSHGSQEGTVLSHHRHRLARAPRRFANPTVGVVRSDPQAILFGCAGDQGLDRQGCATVGDRGCFAQEGADHFLSGTRRTLGSAVTADYFSPIV